MARGKLNPGIKIQNLHRYDVSVTHSLSVAEV